MSQNKECQAMAYQPTRHCTLLDGHDGKHDFIPVDTPSNRPLTQREDWDKDERIKQLANPSSFDISIHILPSVDIELDPEERARMSWKLGLVEQAAGRLAAAMLKGTLKYSDDIDEPDYWAHHLLSDGLDTVNYIMFMFDTMSRKGLVRDEFRQEF